MDWKKIFDSLGMDGSRWQWRIMRWERNWTSFWRGDIDRHSSLSLTRALIYINCILFVAMLILGFSNGRGLNAILSPDTMLLRAAGAQFWPYVLDHDQWWRCITYAYTHGGLIHLGFNMMVLYQVGPLIEQEIGPARFFVLYTLAALTATAAGYLWHPLVTVVGASGSLFGLIGFATAYYHRVGPAAHQLRNFMFKWAVLAFAIGIMVGADNAAHLGGALCGAAFGLILPLGYRGRQRYKALFNLLAGICIVATIVSLVILLSSLLIFFWR